MTTRFYLYHLAGFSLKKRLLTYFFSHPEARLYLREIGVLLHADPANLSRELSKLEQEGIFLSKKQGNLKYYFLNRAYAFFEELKSIALKISEQNKEIKTRDPSAQKRTVYVIAGPNGAGKTTFAKKFLPEYVKCKQFANADLIASGLSPFSPEGAALSAGKLLIEKIRDLSRRGKDFGFETTLSGKSYVPFLKQLREQGYAIHLFFLWIPTLELALARIRDRVRRGGHDIPEPVVKRRFHKGIQYLFKLYRPLLDSWALFDNSQTTPHLIAAENDGNVEVIDQVLYERISKIAEAK
jgi:predicted ABC-type ATPase/predicted transcriptional regulator with HTH domain